MHRFVQGRLGDAHRQAEHLRRPVHSEDGIDEGRGRKVDDRDVPSGRISNFEDRLGERSVVER